MAKTLIFLEVSTYYEFINILSLNTPGKAWIIYPKQ